MQCFLVGGAVRDALLGLPVKDKDWVVVGATPEYLLKKGYQQVGKDFPVFLHPKTKQEYALARKEKKVGAGYTGFICDFSPDISLKEDLYRRDLTINAMAQDETGKLFDFYGGQADLAERLLRHVSPAFVEDPLRVLRTARFLARFAHLGFKVAPETFALMKEICTQGELRALSRERIWQETAKALQTPTPTAYFSLLQQLGALPDVMPALVGALQENGTVCGSPQNFVENSSLTESTQITALDRAFARYFFALPMGRLTALCQQLGVPNATANFAKLAQQFAPMWREKTQDLNAVLAMFNAVQIWRSTEKFDALSQLFSTCFPTAQRQQQRLMQCFARANAITAQQVIADGFQHANIRQELDRRRLQAMQAVLSRLE